MGAIIHHSVLDLPLKMSNTSIPGRYQLSTVSRLVELALSTSSFHDKTLSDLNLQSLWTHCHEFSITMYSSITTRFYCPSQFFAAMISESWERRPVL